MKTIFTIAVIVSTLYLAYEYGKLAYNFIKKKRDKVKTNAEHNS